MAEPEAAQSESHVPASIHAILSASLTERGMDQWWYSHNRYLNTRPCEAWAQDYQDRVKEAAHAFDQGFYL